LYRRNIKHAKREKINIIFVITIESENFSHLKNSGLASVFESKLYNNYLNLQTKTFHFFMIYILNIETATRNCSVSISQNGQLLASKEIAEVGFSHAEKLHVFIEEILKTAQITFHDLSAIAVSKGPGSYTGLRIGVSAAKGFCYALDIPLIAIDTLQILARKLDVQEGVIIPMIDARRMECYTAIFDSKFEKIRAIQAEIITEESYIDIQETIHLIGDGAAKCKTILTNSKFVFHDDIEFPSAKEMSQMSYESYKKSDTVDVAYFEPFYLKDFMVTASK
jgi:tRNA threonylcarbamoyladenosine biosynthesis protein TsaB